jgi:hypothetical protein
MLLSIKDPDKKMNIYYELKELLFEKNSMLSNDQIRLLFTYLENTASRYMSFQGTTIYYNELYDLYAFQNKHKILLETKTSVPILIKNFVTVLLNFNKHDEANEFLDANKKTILPLFKNHFDICKAMIAFDMGKPEDALGILNEINLKNIYLKISEKRLRIKIYYELGYYDLLMDHINSFRVYLSNNKDDINEYHIVSNKNFIKFVSQISKTNTKENHSILKEINNTGRMTEKKWLISILGKTN